jgi:DNA-binding CsgD family transcriptional regulator
LRTSYSPREAVARFSLTAREAQVLHLLLEGASNAEIGTRLKIAETTAHDHVQSILKKTGVHRRSQIVAKVLGLREG